MSSPRDVMTAAGRAALAAYLQAWERTITGQAQEQAFRNSMAVQR